MPAEWEQHEATWIAWPHNLTDWPGKFTSIQWVYGEIVRKLTPGELVRIIVQSKEHEARARRVLQRAAVDLSRVEFFRFPSNRGWTRDFGPIFVKRIRDRSKTVIARFRFNAWAKYKDWQKDDRIPERVAKELGIELVGASLNRGDFILEGGSIDVNGSGSLLTTEECLLDQESQARNPGATREEIEQALMQTLGITNVIWLNRGIEGDDTHGHVDDISRFVSRQSILTCRERNKDDYNYRVLEENLERLQDARLEDGSKPELIDLPMPAPLIFEGRRLPASYANFYIGNSVVLVPTFNDLNDRIALGIIGDLFPERQVTGIHAVDLVWGLGTLHCLTQQQPSQ